jgi:4-hydroxy-3-methylbut-2-enyl diphosphate reductase
VAIEAQKGLNVLIWGAAEHPEVAGLLGYAEGLGHAFLGPEDVAGLPDFSKVLLVAQTTQNQDLWPEVKAAVLSRWPNALIRDTICLATINRQEETRRLCRTAESLVVVGGKDSGNTQRLVEIGQKAGIPTLAVEGPEDVRAEFFEGTRQVAIAAGASTPIWQIRAVAQKLEAVSRIRGASPFAIAKRLFRALALSNVYVGLGAGALGYAIAKWAGFEPPGYFFGLYFFYVQAMHLLNGFLDRASSRYNDPDRAVFLSKYRLSLAAFGVSSLGLSLSAAFLAGRLALLQLLIQSFLGLAYAMPWPFKLFKVRRLSDLPMSKTLSTAGGWAVLLVGPAILADPPLIPRTLEGVKLAFILGGAVFLNVLARSAIMESQEAFGDRLFGRRTLVSYLGRSGTIRFLTFILIVWGAYLLGAYAFGGPNVILWLILWGPIYNAVFLKIHWKGLGLLGFRLDLILDAQFLFAGLGFWLL